MKINKATVCPYCRYKPVHVVDVRIALQEHVDQFHSHMFPTIHQMSFKEYFNGRWKKVPLTEMADLIDAETNWNMLS